MRLALLGVPAVRSAVGLEIGREIEYHARLRSTQDRGRELAAAGSPAIVVVADEQTAGQGTQGRSWHAPAGTSLLASWLFRPSPAEPAVFALLAGVALARALARLGFADARLKWPNDVEAGRRKIAGVLAHAATDGEGGSLVLGIGVNVHQRLEDYPPELRESATSLALAGHTVDRLSLLIRLTGELDRVADVAERAAALDEWRRRATLLGREVEVIREGRPTAHGVARDIADDGALLVGSERVVAGEVRVVG
ncbi:MAG TPA: biotin--[acetyl-CoA-carboxylase] ligase [Candidatus Limnocylindria bacterium]|jgi:BirA family biotin operon repressor/biotin-[acetyl-CoA-carboxylase] ligase|nr:biotin--[acetyl-CoA-carboxylase] ligase [Candidatus Limnocylindria bacterium]